MGTLFTQLKTKYANLQRIPKYLLRSVFVSIWFTLLTFPIMVIQVNTVTNTITWWWGRLILIFLGSLIGGFIWFIALDHKDRAKNARGLFQRLINLGDNQRVERIKNTIEKRKILLLILVLICVLIIPFITKSYFTRVLISAMIMMILGVGLNVVVGYGGLLNLGYAAYFAVGAYTYGLLNHYFGIGFWVALPISAFASTIAGLLVALPVIRLRGDYLAIITLAFGEITRIVLENWGDFTFGPSGVKEIDKPGLFGIELAQRGDIIYVYMIALLLLCIAIIAAKRMESSRIGRSWESLRENEIASRSMGINIPRTKLLIFAVGAFWAGVAGALFATNFGFINPKSFSLLESVKVLCVVVLGGMGSIPGVIVGSIVLQVIPEWLRPLRDYRLLVFGALLVVMMIFKPNGFFPKVRKSFTFKEGDGKHDTLS